MTADDYRVNITYPADFSSQLQDEAWLTDVAERRHGRLGDVLESFPQQQHATFQEIDDARAFVEELSCTGRWRAAIRA